MAKPTSLAEIAGETVGEAIAFAAGFAAARALEPIGVGLAQSAWEHDAIRAPDAQTLAEGIAQGQVARDDAYKWAKQHGYGQSQMDALVAIANTGPALGLAYQAWRRGELSDGEFTTAMQRTGLEAHWYPALRALKADRLDLGAIATAVHRGIMAGHGLIVTEPPSGGGKVPHVAQSNISPVTEAESHGIDAERMRILVGNTGLPPGLMEMLRLLNMGHVTDNDVRRAVAQSNLRNEYMEVVLALRRQLLTPHEYAEAHLRGWITESAMRDGAALHGMEADDVALLFKNLGRPLNVHAVVTALARGGKYGGEYAGVPEPFQTALRESNVRPEWGNLAYANRYSYPGAFVIRTMAQAGDLTRAETHTILLQIGWPPDLATKVAARWTTAGGDKADAHVGRAATQLWSSLHTAYVNEDTDDATAREHLAALGVAEDAQQPVLELWRRERTLTTKPLTPSQIKKAYTDAQLNLDDAIVRLEQQGMNEEDARLLLGAGQSPA